MAVMHPFNPSLIFNTVYKILIQVSMFGKGAYISDIVITDSK